MFSEKHSGPVDIPSGGDTGNPITAASEVGTSHGTNGMRYTEEEEYRTHVCRTPAHLAVSTSFVMPEGSSYELRLKIPVGDVPDEMIAR